MFLFTTPTSAGAPATPPPAGPVVDAIRQGAERTGTDFDYLLRTAQRESSLDPAAKAPTSSASGLFQFIEQTWLGLVKSDGEKAGIGAAAQAVTARPDGTFSVADPAARDAILKLREDPQLAATMAGSLTQQNRDVLKGALGREPTSGELYMAHVFGARGASDLIATAQSAPTRAASLDFPEAARANRSIFFDRAGRARGAGEVYGLLAGTAAFATTGPTAASAVTPAAPASPSVTVTTQTRATGLGNLFQTGPRQAPVSDAVARIWRVNHGEVRTQVASASFFPRTTGNANATEAADAGSSPAASVEPAEVAGPPMPAPPLPPARPRFFGHAAFDTGGARPLDLASLTRVSGR